LRKKHRVWLARFYHRGQLIEVSTHETDQEKARKVLRTLLRTADTAAFRTPATAKVTFEDLCDLLRRDHRKKNNRSRIEYKLKRLAETFAGRAAIDITTADVEAYADAREEADAARATVNRELAALRRMFRLGIKAGLLPTMPQISTPAEDNIREGFLDPPDALAFLAHLRAENADVADATEFAYQTVLRRGNVLGALWTWFELDVQGGHVVGGGLRVPGLATKNKTPLTLPLTGDLLALIDRRWQVRVPSCAYVFHHGGIPVTRFDALWRQAATAIGRPALLFHDLRRSAARTLRRAGVDEDTIMRLGGWKTRSMFTRYAIVDERDLADARAKFDAALRAPGSRTVVPLRAKKPR
jgi:integrase